MLKLFATNAVISKGYNGAPALKFSDKGTGAFFQVGHRVYDAREDNTRWVNLQVKAFNNLCERIKKMQLKEGSYVNIVGHLDEDIWQDSTTNERKRRLVVILDDIEFASSNSGKSKDNNNSSGYTQPQNNTQAPAAPATQNAPGQFTGFEPFGGVNSFFDD